MIFAFLLPFVNITVKTTLALVEARQSAQRLCLLLACANFNWGK